MQLTASSPGLRLLTSVHVKGYAHCMKTRLEYRPRASNTLLLLSAQVLYTRRRSRQQAIMQRWYQLVLGKHGVWFER